MSEAKNDNNHLRFFSQSSIVKNKEGESSLKSDDPKPFGLNYEEQLENNLNGQEEGVSMHISITQTPSGPDFGPDIDW